MFCDVVENGVTNTDKLLICLAIILFLTIVWTILIGIMYKMRGRDVVVKKTNRFLLDEDDDDEKIVVAKKVNKTTKKTTKKTTSKKTKKPSRKTTKKTTKRSNSTSAAKTTRVVKSNSNQEVYVKVRFYGTSKDLIYVAPENVILRKGEKIKVRTDEGNIRTATVAQGNYLREKYKTYEYQTLELV